MRVAGIAVLLAACAAAERAFAEPPAASPDLFGCTALPIGVTPYDAVWRGALASALPREDPELDAFVARLSAMPMRERVEAANAWINARVPFVLDPDELDHWAGLAEGLARRHGEGEDIAAAKFQLLEAAGVPPSAMYLVLVRDTWRLMKDDALLEVRDGGEIYVLDERQDVPLATTGERGRYFPVIALGERSRWIFGVRHQPSRWSATARPATTVAAVSAAAW